MCTEDESPCTWLPYGYRLGYSLAMARKQPRDWPAEADVSAQRAAAIADAGRDPAPLRHPLAGPYVRLGRHDPPIALQFGHSPEGRLICTGLLVGWQLNAIGDPTKLPSSQRRELTARALRRIKLPEILSDLDPLSEDEELGGPRKRSRKGTTGADPIPPWLLQSLPVVGHPGPKGHPDEHYRMVAQRYETALLVAPRSPMKWLAEQLHCSGATAHRWRDEAARRGFLPSRPRVRRGPPKRKGPK